MEEDDACVVEVDLGAPRLLSHILLFWGGPKRDGPQHTELRWLCPRSEPAVFRVVVGTAKKPPATFAKAGSSRELSDPVVVHSRFDETAHTAPNVRHEYNEDE